MVAADTTEQKYSRKRVELDVEVFQVFDSGIGTARRIGMEAT